MAIRHSCAKLLFPVLVVTFPTKAAAEVFGNEQLIALSKTNIGDPVLIAMIEQRPCAYDLAIPQIAKLKKAGVTNPVIAALIRRCNAADTMEQESAETLYPGSQPGIYLVLDIAGYQAFERIVPAIVASGQSHGVGSVLLPRRSRLTLPGSSAIIYLS